MKILFNTLKINFYQALYSKLFFISILMTTLLGMIVMKNFVDMEGLTTTYLLDLFIGLSMPKKLVIIFAALPFSASFCTEWNHQYTQPLVSRTGIKTYVFAKFLVNFIIAFFITFIGVTLAVAVLGFHHPLVDIEMQGIESFAPFQSLISSSFPFSFVLAKVAVFSLASGAWASAGMMYSAFIPNYFVTITSSIVFSYILEEFTTLLPDSLNLYSLTKSLGSPYEGAFFSFLYFLGVFLLYAIFFGYIYYQQVKRRILNEVN